MDNFPFSEELDKKSRPAIMIIGMPGNLEEKEKKSNLSCFDIS